MSHDYTPEIEAAFAAFELKRTKRVELPPLRFECGPYFPPQVEIGDEIECARFGLVRMIGWSEGPLPWPQCRLSSSPSMILFADLERALKVECLQAIAVAWGTWAPTVSAWRKALGVGRTTRGTSARWSENFNTVITPEQQRVGLKRAHEPEFIQLANRTRRAHGNLGNQHDWSEEEVAWLGVLTDKEVAERLDCNKLTVARERRRRGIATTGTTGHATGLLPFDGAKMRARRLALGLTQPDVAARIERCAGRVSYLESGLAVRVKPQTLEAITRALECSSDALLQS